MPYLHHEMNMSTRNGSLLGRWHDFVVCLDKWQESVLSCSHFVWYIVVRMVQELACMWQKLNCKGYFVSCYKLGCWCFYICYLRPIISLSQIIFSFARYLLRCCWAASRRVQGTDMLRHWYIVSSKSREWILLGENHSFWSFWNVTSKMWWLSNMIVWYILP
jgi:hypothetical protein